MLTLACALGFVWAGMNEFDAIVHAFSTLATGGMGNYDSSFADFSPAAQYVGTVFMLLGALSFIRFVQFARGEPRRAVPRQPESAPSSRIYLALCRGADRRPRRWTATRSTSARCARCSSTSPR